MGNFNLDMDQPQSWYLGLKKKVTGTLNCDKNMSIEQYKEIRDMMPKQFKHKKNEKITKTV